MRTYPLLGRVLYKVECPEVPWALLEPHRTRALRNHDQTLERLAERGGLSPAEIMTIIEDRAFYPMKYASDEEAIPALIAAINKFNGAGS